MDALRSRINDFQQLIRWNEWGDSKLPFIFLALLLLLMQNPNQYFDLAVLLAILGFSFFYLAFGYVFNDWMDREADRMVGKVKRVQQWSSWQAIGLLAFFVFASLIFIFPWMSNGAVLIIIGLCYILAITYSGTFLRFKERGWAGVLVASVAQRTLPVCLLYAILGIWDKTTILFLILTLLIGFRWMVTHQVDDLERDKATSTRTFATRQNQQYLNSLLVWILNLEILSLLILAGSVGSPALWWIYSIYFLLSCLLSIATHSTPWQMLKTPATAYLVLADFYFLYWPFGMMIWLGIIQYPYWWLLAVLLVLLLQRYLRQHLSDLSWLYGHFKKVS
jgi:4-hydroxybenzoate polyprenyltransferase